MVVGDFKYLTKQQLLDAINDTPDSSVFTINIAGNLSVLMDGGFGYIGYIDFAEGDYGI